MPIHLRDGPPEALGVRAARAVRQAVVLTFQNLRFVFDSCLRLLRKAYMLFGM